MCTPPIIPTIRVILLAFTCFFQFKNSKNKKFPLKIIIIIFFVSWVLVLFRVLPPVKITIFTDFSHLHITTIFGWVNQQYLFIRVYFSPSLPFSFFFFSYKGMNYY